MKHALAVEEASIAVNIALPETLYAIDAIKKGHYSAHCLTKRKQVSQIEGEVTADNAYEITDPAFLGEVGSSTQMAWLTTLNLNGYSTQFKLDTGAEVTAITEQTYESIESLPLSKPSKTLYGPSRQPLKSLGQFSGKFCHKDRTTMQPVFVVNGLKVNLLGLPAITTMNLAVQVDATEAGSSNSRKMDRPDFRKQFSSLFHGLGNLGEPYEIHLKPGAVPHCIFTPRHVPLPLREQVKQELDQMESMGVITKINDPTPWCAGMVVVPKKEGKIRICVN